MSSAAHRIAVIGSIVLFLVVVTRTAWICDDAMITFRTVDNFVNGYGLTWNINERVQVYSNPLWMFVISAFHWIPANIYYTSIFVSMGVSLLAVMIFALKIAPNPLAAVAGVLTLTVSKAFTDYSTSGLENPLTHLLLAVFVAVFLHRGGHGHRGGHERRRVMWLSLVAACAAVNRLDNLVLVMPAVCATAWSAWHARHGRAERIGVLLAAFAGFTPLLAWELFSLLYYGFPFPNPAYAKLGAGVPGSDLIAQGGRYFANSLRWDPITLLVSALASVAMFRRRGGGLTPLLVGVLVYFAYTLRIGGDFMSGRFFAAPFFCSVLLLSRVPVGRKSLGVVLVFVLAIGGTTAKSPLWSGMGYKDKGSHADDIADERGEFYRNTGLLQPFDRILHHHITLLALQSRARGPHVMPFLGAVGFLGYIAGPHVHIVDSWALCDPLLARLPADTWRIGHFARELPKGYVPTLESGVNRFEDERMAGFYEQLRLITRGRLFSWQRLEGVVRMNLGMYEHPAVNAPPPVPKRRAN